jgi:hypothetical protein
MEQLHEPASKYVLYEIRLKIKQQATTNLNAVLSEHIVLNAGASFKSYNRIIFNSLWFIGGSYFDDIDAFYSGNRSQIWIIQIGK